MVALELASNDVDEEAPHGCSLRALATPNVSFEGSFKSSHVGSSVWGFGYSVCHRIWFIELRRQWSCGCSGFWKLLESKVCPNPLTLNP